MFSFSLLTVTNSYKHANIFGMLILLKLEASGYTRKQAQSVIRNTWQESSGPTKHLRFTWARGATPQFRNRNIIVLYRKVTLLKIVSSAIRKRNNSAKYMPGHTLVLWVWKLGIPVRLSSHKR